MLSKLSFPDEDVAKICQDPFKNLKNIVEDLKVEVPKGKGKPTSVKVLSNEYSLRKNTFNLSNPQLIGHGRTEFRKCRNVEEAKKSTAIGLLWKLLMEGDVKEKNPQS